MHENRRSEQNFLLLTFNSFNYLKGSFQKSVSIDIFSEFCSTMLEDRRSVQDYQLSTFNFQHIQLSKEILKKKHNRSCAFIDSIKR
jgi:hypothetical protein